MARNGVQIRFFFIYPHSVLIIVCYKLARILNCGFSCVSPFHHFVLVMVTGRVIVR